MCFYFTDFRWGICKHLSFSNLLILVTKNGWLNQKDDVCDSLSNTIRRCSTAQTISPRCASSQQSFKHAHSHGCIWVTCWLWAKASPPEGYISTVPLRNTMDMLNKKTGSEGEGTQKRALCLWRAWIQMDFNVDWEIVEMLKKKRNSSPCTVTMEREAPNHRVHSTCSDSNRCISP